MLRLSAHFIALYVIQMGEAYKVLLVTITPCKSHSILADRMIRHLVQAGHEVTFITPYPKGPKQNSSVREIDISIMKEYMPEELFRIDRTMNKEVDMQGISSVTSLFYKMNVACLENENVVKFLNDPSEQFDVVILEWMFLELLSGISAIFNCPYIWFSTVDPHWMVLKLIDEIPNPAYVTGITSDNEVPLSFLQRAEELWQVILNVGLQYFHIYGNEHREFERLLAPIIRKRGHKVPDFEEVRYNASLMLGNSHVSMGQPTRLPQNYKAIGGYHIDANANPLPQDLKDLLDNAKDGLIYFSMGSLAKSKNMPQELKGNLLKMFGKIKKTVLWKFEEDLQNRPPNVHIVHWAPQQSILGNMRDTHLFLRVVLVGALSSFCSCSKILIVFPMVGKSHDTLAKSCARLLLEAGHQVTLLKWGPDMEPHQNLTVIDIRIPTALETRYSLKKSLSGIVNLNNMHEFTKIMSELQRKVLQHDAVQKLIQDPNVHFDVAILEWIYGEYVVGLPAIFGCPYIWFSSMEPHSMILGMIGEITNPAYIPMNFHQGIPPLNFMNRVTNLKYQLYMYLFKELYIQPMEEKDYQKHIAPLILKRHGVVPSYNELRYNASMVLGNSHVSVGRPIPLPEAYRSVGGYHVETSTEVMPKDIELLMNKSTDGVIYFSLGSSFRSSDLPAEAIDKLLKFFSGLKQTILWKFEEDIPNKPSNVHIVPWAPQNKILAHPNCILFISHGGQLSVLEAVHYGVPVIGVPIFVDQHTNVKTLAVKGMAIEVDIYNLATELVGAIKKVLDDSWYSHAAKRQSLIYHNRIIPPGAEMVYWVEYVVRHNGAKHLRSLALLVPWYQKSYLDVAVTVISVIVLLVLVIKRLVSLTLNKVKKNKAKAKKKH